MEASPENRLPEVDSLPDGFVESAADPPAVSSSPPPPSPRVIDYKDALLETDPSAGSAGRSSGSPGETVSSPVADGAEGGERPTMSSVSSQETDGCGGGSVGVVGEGVVSGPAGDATSEASTGTKGSQEAVSAASRGEQSGGDRPSAGRGGNDSQCCLKLHTTNLKESPAVERSKCPKNQKLEQGSEAKRKVVKRSVKSEKESPEFNLKYQKVIAERDAAIVVRERLESLCRELQRQNKMLMDECQRVSTEGQNIRLEFSTKFNDAIKDVSNKLEAQKDECLSQLKENEMLRDKLKHLAEQYTLSEQQFAQKLKEKMLELQIADLKIQQHQERSAQEQSQMQLYVEQVAKLLETEKHLRLQLAADGDKFQQFQDALVKSNEVFETFKQEMEKMAKLSKDFKKENASLKTKCEEKDYSIVNLLTEREAMKKELSKVIRQKESLESLCRSLQAERKVNLAKASSGQEDS